MRWYTVNHRSDHSSRRPKPLVDRAFFLDDVPRPILRCRLFGHKPVVDGVDYGTRGARSRWVVCDRCGIRPHPQGSLDPERWTTGQPYDGPFDATFPTTEPERRRAIRDRKGATHAPGPWRTAKGDLGGHVILGRKFGGLGFDVKIGCGGSESTFALSLRFYPLGALYVHVGEHGRWLQRRLNPTDHVSRVTGLSISDGDLYWQVWADQNGGSDGQPRWRNGWTAIDPRDIILGPVLHDYTKVGIPVTVTVRMPHGDDHTASVTLQKVRTGRRRWRHTETWKAKWHCAEGIPTKSHGRGGVVGAFVDIGDEAVKQGTWPAEAAAEIASRITRDRVNRGYEPAPTTNSVG